MTDTPHINRTEDQAANSTEADQGPRGAGDYVVRQGECMNSIAAAHGFFWETLWDLTENQELRCAREEPNVLLPGDRVYIPELREKVIEAPTEARHLFRRRGVPSTLRIQIMRAGVPRSNEQYLLEIDGFRSEGVTNDEGWVEIAIPPSAERGELRFGNGEFETDVYPFNIGGLDPITEITGVQERLANLGYDCSVTGEMDNDTRQAILAFQEAEDLETTEELDQTTRDRIAQVYG